MCKHQKNNEVLLKEIQCKFCYTLFYLCRSCYRGHIYCSNECRKQAEIEAHRKAQSKYRTSEKGRIVNKIAQRQRRIKTNKKTVADRGSIKPIENDILNPTIINSKAKCHFCGKKGIIISEFPRRGYANNSSKFEKRKKTSKIKRQYLE